MKTHLTAFFIQIGMITTVYCNKYHQTLGLKENATLEDAKFAFR